MRTAAHPQPEQPTLTALLQALSDPVRLKIVVLLYDGAEIPCGRLGVPVSKSTLSHHLKVLRDAGVTHTRAEGVQRFISLRRVEIESRFPGLLGCVMKESQRLSQL